MLRAVRCDDAEMLAALYRESVHGLGRLAYGQREIEAWARYPEHLEEFAERLSRGTALLVERDDGVAAFGQLDPADHIALLYTRPHHARRGYATIIYDALERTAIGAGSRALEVEASRVARPFFAAKGFAVVAVEAPVRHGVAIERFRMRKML